jgi:pre-mRNA-splicing factor ATP-dependent RNA helicase DHX15/PRP43
MEDGGPAKRRKTNGADLDPKANPYLAHLYDEEVGYANGFSNGDSGKKSKSDPLSGLTRHQTTAEQASVAEDGPDNPFTGRLLSKRYFDILKTRRNLPVHAQRYAPRVEMQFNDRTR